MYEIADTGIPHYVLLDRNGRIAAIGELNKMEEAIARLGGKT